VVVRTERVDTNMQSPVPLFTVLAIIIIVVVNRRRHRIYDGFRVSSATSPERARNLSDIGIRPSILFAYKVKQKVIGTTGDHTYYLDEERLEKVIHVRRKIAFVLGVSVLIFAFILFQNS